jgi:hypothetical protein
VMHCGFDQSYVSATCIMTWCSTAMGHSSPDSAVTALVVFMASSTRQRCCTTSHVRANALADRSARVLDDKHVSSSCCRATSTSK